MTSATWDPETTAVIVNPAAGGGRVGKRWPELGPRLRELLGDVRFELTRGPGDGILRAQEVVLEGATTVLALGGDGTHSEVLNGVMAAEPAPGAVTLGLLPSGTGGDFRRLLLHGQGPEEAARALPTARASAIDVGSVDYLSDQGTPGRRWFLNIAACGLSGTTVRIVNRSSKAFGGRVTFFLGAVRAVLGFQAPTVRLVLDGEVLGERPVNNVVVCNGRYAGGGMMFAPEARLADGALDVVLFAAVPWWKTLSLSGSIYSGEHVRSDQVEVVRGQVLRVEPVSAAAPLIDVDGESPGRAPAEFRVHTGAVRLLDLDPQYL